MCLRANYHTHTTLCDGTSTPEQMIEKAINLGFTQLGFSGHMDADIHMDYDKYVSIIEELKTKYSDRINILIGVELDNLFDPSIADRAEYVIGSTHFFDVDYKRPLSIDDTPEDVVLLCNEFFGGDYFRLCKAYFELEASIIDKFPCTFIGHFDLVTKYNHVLHFIDEEDPKYLNPAVESMEYLVKKGIPFEINTRQASRKKLFPGGKLLKALKQFNGDIVISSDAHNAEELNIGFEYALSEVKRAGFDHINNIIIQNKKAILESVKI